MDEKERMALKNELARVYVDRQEDSRKAVDLLRRAGFHIIVFPVELGFGQQVRIGKKKFRGLKEIEGLVNEV